MQFYSLKSFSAATHCIKVLDEMFVYKLYLCSPSLLLVIMSQKQLAVKPLT